MYIKRNAFRLMLIISLLFGTGSLNAFVYDGDVLDIYSKIMPRFVLMSSQKEKIENTLEICILHDKVDERTALSLIEKVNNNYPQGIKDYKIKLLNGSYLDMEPCKNSQMSFMFNTSDKNIKKALEFSDKHVLLTVAYDKELLEKGVSISLFLGRKVTPYVNIKALRRNGVELNNVLLRISKIYEGGAN